MFQYNLHSHLRCALLSTNSIHSFIHSYDRIIFPFFFLSLFICHLNWFLGNLFSLMTTINIMSNVCWFLLVILSFPIRSDTKIKTKNYVSNKKWIFIYYNFPLTHFSVALGRLPIFSSFFSFDVGARAGKRGIAIKIKLKKEAPHKQAFL